MDIICTTLIGGGILAVIIGVFVLIGHGLKVFLPNTNLDYRLTLAIVGVISFGALMTICFLIGNIAMAIALRRL